MKQKQALDILKIGANVFLTGRAGSGKTYVLNEYIKYLRHKKIRVGVTAATGIAATHLNGTTIHSWSGLGISDKLSDKDIKKLLKKTYLKKHFLDSSVLMIDEVSMLHAHQLDLVNFLCQAFRQSIEPFGGLQVVLSGDFFQLPPVSHGNTPAKFVTESEIWHKMNLRVCYLDEQFRQDDTDFLNILNEIRSGKVSQTSRELLHSRLDQSLESKLKPTKLYSHNVDVDAINFIELKKIPGELKSHLMRSRGNKNLVALLKNSCLAPENLILKIGAKVMFIKNNFELGVVNGTVGEVIDFNDLDYPIVKIKTGEIITVEPEPWRIDEENKILAEICQIPLRLAWAITVHKSQGMSLDLAEVDLSKSFVPGMGYVALSRVRSLAGLKLKGINQMALQVNDEVLAFDQNLQKQSQENIWHLDNLSTQELTERHQKFVNKNKTNFTQEPKFKIKKVPNKIKTLALLKQKKSLSEIADELNLKVNTITTHLEKLVTDGAELDLSYLKMQDKDFKKIKSAFDECGLELLKPVHEYLKEKYDYADLRLARILIVWKKKN